MNRRSFVSILTGICGAVVTGLGFGKKQKLPSDPADLPWRKGRKSQPISFPETPTDTPLVAHGPGYVREPMADGNTLRVTTYHRIPNGRMIGCSSAPEEHEELHWVNMTYEREWKNA